MNNTPTIRIQKVRKNRTKRMFIIFSILAAALLICSIIAPLLCPYDPYAQDLSKSLQPPSANIGYVLTDMARFTFTSNYR